MLRRVLLICTTTALVASAVVGLTVTSAQAASSIDARSNFVAVEAPNAAGHRPVYVYAVCTGSSTCTGKATILGQTRSFTWPYSIPANSSGYMTMYWLGDEGNPLPTGLGPAPGVQGTTFERQLWVDPDGASPRQKTITLERRQDKRNLKGTVAGPGFGTRVKDAQVTRWYYSGLVSKRLQTVDVASDGSFDFGSFSLGRNNASSYGYRLSIRAKVDGTEREWFWRGAAGGDTTYGGGKRIDESHFAAVNKLGDFQAPFRYGRISGTLSGSGSSGADVRVIAPPVSRPTAASDLRGLDVPYCANEFGRDTASSGGQYDITFLPVSQLGDDRYLVAHDSSADAGIVTQGGRQYGTCSAALNYSTSSSDDDLIGYGAGGLDADVSANLNAAAHTLTFDSDGTFSSTQDQWTTVREYTPGTKILDQPILKSGYANSAGYVQFAGMRPGKYWVEIGRRVKCSAWYPSIYTDNYAYHDGADRGNERWKTVNGKYPEYDTSYRYGYVAKTPPSGYKGWMYRDVCRADTTGAYQLVTVGNGDVTSNVATSPRGATISGKITRSGGRSNKELLVSAYSTQGVLVMRSAYTSSSGTFVIRGLASGNYRLLVNGDSWRGIGRGHSGTQTKKVTAGGSYSVGTLNFSG